MSSKLPLRACSTAIVASSVPSTDTHAMNSVLYFLFVVITWANIYIYTVPFSFLPKGILVQALRKVYECIYTL